MTKLTGKGIRDQIKDMCKNHSPKSTRSFTMFTGEKGVDDFDIEMIILGVDHEELKNRYREVRNELYDINHKYRKLTSNKLIKLFIWLRIIK